MESVLQTTSLSAVPIAAVVAHLACVDGLEVWLCRTLVPFDSAT